MSASTFRSNATYRALALGAIAALGYAALALVPCGTPLQMARTYASAVSAGDLDTLMRRACFGVRDDVQQEADARGRSAFNARVAIYEKQQREGERVISRRLERVQALEREARELGESAFRDLALDDKWAVWVAMPRVDWQFQTARARLDEDERALLSSRDVLDDDTVRADTELQLGCTLEGEDAVLVLEQTRAGTLDPLEPVVRRVLEACERTGRRELRSVERRLEREVRRIDSGWRRPDSDLVPQASNRQRAYEIEQGEDRLSDSNRSFLETHRPWRDLDSDARRALALELGRELLTDDERALIGSVPFEEFLAGESDFVNAEGRRLFSEELRERHLECDWRPRRLRRDAALSPRVFGTWRARLQQDWEPRGAWRAAHGDEPLRRIDDSEVVPDAWLRNPAVEAVTFGAARRRGALRGDVRLVEPACSGSVISEFRRVRGRWTADPDQGPHRFERNPEKEDDR